MTGTAETRGNLITSLHMDIDDLEAHIRKLEAKYRLRGSSMKRAPKTGTRRTRRLCWWATALWGAF